MEESITKCFTCAYSIAADGVRQLGDWMDCQCPENLGCTEDSTDCEFWKEMPTE